MQNIETLRNTAAEIAAAAVYELYPNVELLGGSSTPIGFSYDLFFPHPVHPQLSDLIEERVRQIVRERRPIRLLEMVPLSARELLKSQGHLARAEELEEVVSDGLVQVIQIGAFHDLCQGNHLKNTAELAAVKIVVEQISEKSQKKRIRITGYCHYSKSELKKFLKKLEKYLDPVQLGEKRGLWSEGVWLAPGLLMRDRLIEFFKEKWFQEALEVSGGPEENRYELHRALHLRLGTSKVAEVWTVGRFKSFIQVSFFKRSKEESISSLHSIRKTLIIMGFDPSAISVGEETAFVVMDELERVQPLVRMERRGNDFYWTDQLEQILLQMLEKNLKVEFENQ